MRFGRPPTIHHRGFGCVFGGGGGGRAQKNTEREQPGIAPNGGLILRASHLRES